MNLPATTISQILSHNLAPETVYTLTGFVGHPIGFGSTTGTQYTVALFAGGNLLDSTSGTGPEGSFVDFTLTYDSAGSPFLGQPLEIRLSSTQAQTAFDALELDAFSLLPEPSSLSLLGIGALGLVAGRVRRRRTRAVVFAPKVH